MGIRYALVIEIGIFLLVVLAVIIYIISVIKTKESDDYNRIIAEYQEYEKTRLAELRNGNKLINDIERKILICKKKLGFKLFK